MRNGVEELSETSRRTCLTFVFVIVVFEIVHVCDHYGSMPSIYAGGAYALFLWVPRPSHIVQAIICQRQAHWTASNRRSHAVWVARETKNKHAPTKRRR